MLSWVKYFSIQNIPPWSTYDRVAWGLASAYLCTVSSSFLHYFYTQRIIWYTRIIIVLLVSHSPLCMVTWQMTQTLASFSRYFSLHLRLQQPAQYTCKADGIIHPKQYICEARGNTPVSFCPFALWAQSWEQHFIAAIQEGNYIGTKNTPCWASKNLLYI